MPNVNAKRGAPFGFVWDKSYRQKWKCRDGIISSTDQGTGLYSYQGRRGHRERQIDGRVVTRWPPEPNGYLHIGHATAVNLDFSLAAEFGGHCHLRFDDTNPTKEEAEYVEAIKEDIRWLGFDWGEHLYFASDFGETKNRSGLNQNG